MRPGDEARRRFLGGLGLACLLLIVPVKLLRLASYAVFDRAIGVAPSLLGPAWVMFLLRSGTGRASRWGLARTAWLVGALAVGLEALQAIPRPGLLARVYYTFDWWDVAASVLSVGAAYGVARAVEGGVHDA